MTEFPQSRISSAEGSSMFTYYASRRWHCQPSRRHLRKDLRILLARRENQLDFAKTDRKRWIARTNASPARTSRVAFGVPRDHRLSILLRWLRLRRGCLSFAWAFP